MTTITVKDILGSLSSFSKDELDQIRRRCLLLSKSLPAKVQTLEDKDWILEGIITVTREMGLGNPSVFQIKNSKSFHSFQQKSDNVREYLEQFTGSFSYIEIMKFGEVCARELARYIRATWDNSKYPLSFERLMNNVHHIPPALERSFPDYLMSGMIKVVVTGEFPEE